MKSFNIGDLKIRIPIIQGGMGVGISLSGLASAVANMGGIGTISTVAIGLTNRNQNINIRLNHIETLRQEIQKARKMSMGVIAVNIMSVLTNFSDMVKTSIEEKIDIIFAGAGLPLDLPKYLGKGIKTKLVPIVSSSRAASIICEKWMQNFNYLPDAFVVEGPKAGGHLGFKANELQDENNQLENILGNVLEVTKRMKERFNKDIPVIAAGGIHSGDDAFQIMEKGAAGVQLGTRFIATEECDASPEFKKAFIDIKKGDIQIIKSPVGLPGRAIFNNFLNETSLGLRRPAVCPFHCIRSCNPKTTSYCIANALNAAYHGNMNDGFAFCGANAGKIKIITSVKNIFQELKDEFLQAKIKLEQQLKNINPLIGQKNEY